MEWYLYIKAYKFAPNGDVLLYTEDRFFSAETLAQYNNNELSAFSVHCVGIWFNLFKDGYIADYCNLVAANITGERIFCRWSPENGIYNVSHETLAT